MNKSQIEENKTKTIKEYQNKNNKNDDIFLTHLTMKNNNSNNISKIIKYS